MKRLTAPLGTTCCDHAFPGATGYTITVYDPSFNKVTSSQQQAETEWTPPQPLARGELYTWQVTAIKEGKEIISPAPAPGAKFKVLDAVKAKKLDRAKENLCGLTSCPGDFVRAGKFVRRC